MPVVLNNCGTWSPKIRVYENRVLSRIFGSKRHEVIGIGENCMRSFIICTLRKV
jgi:hypothetical protein